MKIVTGLCTILILFSGLISAQEAQNQITVKEYINLPYVEGDDTLRQLNLLIPQNIALGPLLIWIGGGAWSYVDRNQEMDLARRFAENGIAVAAVGHQLSNPVWQDTTLEVGLQHPVHIKDLARALRWLIDRAGKYGYREDQIFDGGFSSGAHLTALLCTNEKYLKEVGLKIDSIKGIIPISGTYDLADYHRVFASGPRPEMAKTHVEAIFGPPQAFAEASPVTFVHKFNTPMFLISENNLFNYTKLFEDKIRETDFQNFEVL